MNDKPWTGSLRQGLRHADDLHRLPLSPEERQSGAEAARTFKVRAPKEYLDLIDWSDPGDPIRRQVLPSADELVFDPREQQDPIGDKAHSPVPRLTHRYPDRVLLYPTYQCAVYCRHCFRKETLNEGNEGFSRLALEPALAYIQEQTALREVILTGGDPLLVADEPIGWLRQRLESVPHLRLLRLHTRIPVVLPSRVTAPLLDALQGRLMVCIVTHFNHPREITPAAAEACKRIRERGFMLLNQSVLLRGVNDDVEVLAALFQELVYTLGAKPYYLHHCDLTRGLSHLRTSIEEGQTLMRGLRGRLSGLCQPTYVLDLPGGAGKIPLDPGWVISHEGRHWCFSDWRGQAAPYEEVLRTGH